LKTGVNEVQKAFTNNPGHHTVRGISMKKIDLRFIYAVGIPIVIFTSVLLYRMNNQIVAVVAANVLDASTGQEIHQNFIMTLSGILFSFFGIILILRLMITKQNDLIAILEKSEEKYRFIFNSAPIGIYHYDLNSVITACNPKGVSMSGADKKQLIGMNVFQSITNESWKTSLKTALQGRSSGYEGEFISAVSGEKLYLNALIVPVFSEGADVAGAIAVVEDITARVIVEQALHEIQKNLETMFDAITEPAFLIDANGVYIALNKTTAQSLGSTVEHLVGKNAFDFLPQDFAASRRKKLEEVICSRKEMQFEDVRFGRYARTNFYPVLNDKGEVIRVAIFTQDIHEHKLAQEALQESEEKARALLNATTDAVVLFNPDGTILDVNESWAKKFDVNKNDVIGRSLWNLFPPDIAEYRKSLVRKWVSTGEKFHGVEKEGAGWVDINSYPVTNKNGEVYQIAVFIRDITEQKRAEDELKTSHQQLQNLAKHLMSVREQERMRIARGLHDEFGQVLTAINIEISMIAKELSESHQNLKERAEAAAELAVGAIQAAKRIISELRPTLLDDLGLAEAIRWQAREYQDRMGVTFDVHIDPEDFFLDDDISISIFRIFQESTTNAIRHSHAARISVSLQQTGAGIELKVKDNGIGISEKQISSLESYGIIGMRERAEILGGAIDISGVPGKGTTVAASFPVWPQ